MVNIWNCLNDYFFFSNIFIRTCLTLECIIMDKDITSILDGRGLKKGTSLVSHLREDFEDIQIIIEKLSQGDTADQVIGGILKVWYFNQTFRDIIRSPIQEIFEDTAKPNIVYGNLSLDEVGDLTLYQIHGEVSPTGIYYNNRFPILKPEEGTKIPYEKIDFNQLPKDVTEKIRSDLKSYYNALLGVYLERMKSMKEQGCSKFHSDFIRDTEEQLDRLKQILIYLDDKPLIKETELGIVEEFIDDGDFFYGTGLKVKSESKDWSPIMTNHRYAGQKLYPIQPGERVMFFKNLAYDWMFEIDLFGHQGTLCKVIKD